MNANSSSWQGNYTNCFHVRSWSVGREVPYCMWMEKERGEVGGIPQAVSQGLVGWSQETGVKQDQSCQTSRGKV